MLTKSFILLKVKFNRKALKKQFLLIFLSAVEGIFTDEKRPFSLEEKNLVSILLVPLPPSFFFFSFSLSKRYYQLWNCTDFISSFPADY